MATIDRFVYSLGFLQDEAISVTFTLSSKVSRGFATATGTGSLRSTAYFEGFVSYSTIPAMIGTKEHFVPSSGASVIVSSSHSLMNFVIT